MIQLLKHRLMLVFALVALPATLMGVVEALEASHMRADQVGEKVRHQADLASAYLQGVLREASAKMRDVAEDDRVFSKSGEANAASCETALTQALRANPAYASLAVLARDGALACTSQPAQPSGRSGPPDYFAQAVVSKVPFLTALPLGSPLSDPTLVFTRSVPDSTGKVAAVLALAINFNKLSQAPSARDLPPSGVLYLLDRDRRLVEAVTAPPSLGAGGLPAANLLQQIPEAHAGTFTATAPDGITRVYVLSEIGDGNLYALAGMPEQPASLWRDRELMTQIALLSAVWITGVVVAWLSTRIMVTRWTERLRETTGALSKGDLSARANLSGAPAEIRQIGDTLGEMAMRLSLRQAELKAALLQKDLMLREIHHRIKNNLQTVISLMNLYSRGAKLGPAAAALKAVRLRTQALALVQRHLYESPGFRTVNTRALLADLCRLIEQSSEIARGRIALTVDAVSVDVGIECAEPMTLLATELITNAYKHTFPGNRSGSIGVALSAGENGKLELRIFDDGIGPSADAASADAFMADPHGLSLSLVRGFATQLEGEIKTEGPPGSSTSVVFTLGPQPERRSAEEKAVS